MRSLNSLMKAVEKGDEAAREPLIQTLGVNASDSSGHTPFNLAAAKGKTKVIKYLCKQPGIDVNARDNEGNHSILLFV